MRGGGDVFLMINFVKDMVEERNIHSSIPFMDNILLKPRGKKLFTWSVGFWAKLS